jgi:hypothetical protein
VNWLEFIEKMFGHVVWPAVVLVVVFAVRKHLGSLAERILELSFGGATVKFGELLAKGTEIVDKESLGALPKPSTTESKMAMDEKLPLDEKRRSTGVADDYSQFYRSMNRYIETQFGDTLGVRSVFRAFDSVD